MPLLEQGQKMASIDVKSKKGGGADIERKQFKASYARYSFCVVHTTFGLCLLKLH